MRKQTTFVAIGALRANECFHLVENNKPGMVHCIYDIGASMQENLSLWIGNNKGADQPA